ncbi:MAG: DsrE family protein [Gammaproteobacteria bacterium]|nr:DsrE family protein [Gammaproteobacteria bacterium]
MNLNTLRATTFIATLFALVFSLGASAVELDDRHALDGVKTGKALFDIASGNPNAMVTVLDIVGETIDGLKRQGVEPQIVVAFRGPAVRFLSGDSSRIPPEHAATAMELATRIEQLAARGVRIEACGITTRMMKMDNATLVKGVQPVANTFNSLIGYQSKGYALIPVF